MPIPRSHMPAGGLCKICILFLTIFGHENTIASSKAIDSVYNSEIGPFLIGELIRVKEAYDKNDIIGVNLYFEEKRLTKNVFSETIEYSDQANDISVAVYPTFNLIKFKSINMRSFHSPSVVLTGKSKSFHDSFEKFIELIKYDDAYHFEQNYDDVTSSYQYTIGGIYNDIFFQAYCKEDVIVFVLN